MKIRFGLFFNIMLALCLLFFKIYQLGKLEMWYRSLPNRSDSFKKKLNFTTDNNTVETATKIIPREDINEVSRTSLPFLNDEEISEIIVNVLKHQNMLEPYCNDKTKIKNWNRIKELKFDSFKKFYYNDNLKNFQGIKHIFDNGTECDKNAFTNILKSVFLDHKDKFMDLNETNNPGNALSYATNIDLNYFGYRGDTFTLSTLYSDKNFGEKVNYIVVNLFKTCAMEMYHLAKVLILQMTTYFSTNECLYSFFQIEIDCKSDQFEKIQKLCFKYTFIKNANYILKNNDPNNFRILGFKREDFEKITSFDYRTISIEDEYQRIYNILVINCNNYIDYIKMKISSNEKNERCNVKDEILLISGNQTLTPFFSKSDLLDPIDKFCIYLKSNYIVKKPNVLLDFFFNAEREIPNMSLITKFKHTKYIYTFLNNQINKPKLGFLISNPKIAFNALEIKEYGKIFEKIYFYIENIRINVFNEAKSDLVLVSTRKYKNILEKYLIKFDSHCKIIQSRSHDGK
ncbi:hypothetical protein EDEG_01448 [Edhazardia aedis USNM 41457]|uniref:Uncharacterized protein n=1 Tax=Edhazardia aedis (strain USNM 41457) TaxID=1003232 RepID=J8ZX69_EDHAE|nr:hypothetical protein EDEG_01448 [Edhazardia aedis USNM 41457]|eukprot:EJW04283.1 hypothetical protein EDEG_01448 [Edhazardia aedis USNM 41457]